MQLTINLPEKAGLLVKAGKKVDFQTPLYKQEKEEEVKLFLADKLGVGKDRIFRHLKKFVGDEIKKGELLAEKKALLSDIKVLSDLDGILKEVNHAEGSILIQVKMEESSITNCFFKGEVVGLEKNLLKLKVGQVKDFPLKESKTKYVSMGGPVFYFEEKKDNADEEDVVGKYLVADSLTSYQQAKLEALGSRGFILLKEPLQSNNLAYCRLKNIDDGQKILQTKLPYCIIDSKESRIYFYS